MRPDADDAMTRRTVELRLFGKGEVRSDDEGADVRHGITIEVEPQTGPRSLRRCRGRQGPRSMRCWRPFESQTISPVFPSMTTWTPAAWFLLALHAMVRPDGSGGDAPRDGAAAANATTPNETRRSVLIMGTPSRSVLRNARGAVKLTSRPIRSMEGARGPLDRMWRYVAARGRASQDVSRANWWPAGTAFEPPDLLIGD